MNPPTSTRVCSFGTVGSGKSTYITCLAMLYHQLFPENRIFSNVHYKTIPYTPIRKANQLFEINEPCFINLDELWHLADSRKGTSVINDVMTALLLRSRRLGWWVGYTEQWYTQVDLRIRFITDIWASPRLYGPVLRVALFDVFGTELGEKWYDVRPAWAEFDTGKDPLTLDLDELKLAYEQYNRRRLGYQ
jgi:hypothetical protein